MSRLCVKTTPPEPPYNRGPRRNDNASALINSNQQAHIMLHAECITRYQRARNDKTLEINISSCEFFTTAHSADVREFHAS